MAAHHDTDLTLRDKMMLNERFWIRTMQNEETKTMYYDLLWVKNIDDLRSGEANSHDFELNARFISLADFTAHVAKTIALY